MHRVTFCIPNTLKKLFWGLGIRFRVWVRVRKRKIIEVND